MNRYFICFVLPALMLAAADPAPMGRIVPVGQRKLHVYCAGTAKPMVLFLNGMPRFSLHFALVQPEVAKFTGACVFDRAGEAWSPAIPGEPTAEATLEEIDAMVRHVAASPVVLAGHSFGGLLARAYYARHPERVAGMVLIDSVGDPPSVTVGDGKKPMPRLTPAELRTLAVKMAERQRSATLPEPKIEPPFDRLPVWLHPAHLWATRNWWELSTRIDPAAALQYQVDMYRAVEGRTLGSLPLVVIARAKSAANDEAWVDQQQRLANLSTKGRLVRAVGSSHDIQLDQPVVVVDAIRSVVEAAR